MHVVFLIDQIYRQGGAEKVLTEKANYLIDKLSYDVTIITTEQNNNPPYYELNQKVKMINLGVNYERDKSYFSYANLKKAPFHFRMLSKVLTELKPSLIVLLNLSFDFYWLPFIFKKVPKWKEFHSSKYFEYQNRINNRSLLQKLKYNFNDWIESKYNKLILLNPDEKDFYKTTNTVVVPNPIGIPNIHAGLVKKQVLAAGRIAPVKGFDQLIAAWQLVHQKQPDWQLHLYGEAYADTKEQLQQQIYACRLENVILFKDSVSNIPNTMLDYSIYAMSSVTECFPMVLLEALSVGLPIVSYDCPNGPRHIITNNSDGLLVANQNPQALAEGLLQLIENDNLRKAMGAKAKKNSSKFEVVSVMQQWMQLFQELDKNQA